MIQYSPMTLQQAVDAVLNRASQHRTAINLDWQTVAMFINRAVREVVAKTLPYKDWGYTSTVSVAHGLPLPINLIKPVRVMVSASGDPPYLEARLVGAKEYYSLTNWFRKQSFNAATLSNPIYCVWGPRAATVNQVPVQSTRHIYLGPYNNTAFGNQTGTPPTGFTYHTGNNMSGFMDCYLSPLDLTNPAQLLPIPYEFENLVLLYSLYRVYAKVGQHNKLQQIQQDSIKEQVMLKERYVSKRQTEKANLEALMDQQPAPPQQKG